MAVYGECEMTDGDIPIVSRETKESGGARAWCAAFVESQLEQPADMVNHPPHYKEHPSGVECITITEHMNFCLGNAVKYIWRAGLKGSAVEDLKKARWYLDREIERLSKEA